MILSLQGNVPINLHAVSSLNTTETKSHHIERGVTMKSCTGLHCWQAVLWSVQQISVSTTRNSLSVPRLQGAPVVQKHF